MLDPTELRILGVLVEKELAVPDSYPMTENALLAGCNQKSNRDPAMSLEPFEVTGALTSLRLKEWVVQVEGGRAHRFRHRLDDRLGLDGKQKAVLTELIVRGPQAPGALKPRVARMGFAGSVEEIEEVLASLRDRPGDALVEQLPRRPRERDQRWGQLLGAEGGGAADAVTEVAAAAEPNVAEIPRRVEPVVVAEPAAPDLEVRVARLESEVGSLREELAELRARLG